MTSHFSLALSQIVITAVVLCFQFVYIPRWFAWQTRMTQLGLAKQASSKIPGSGKWDRNKRNNSYFSPKKLWNCDDSATPVNPIEPIRLIISLVELSERCSSGVTVQGTKLDNLYYHKFYPPSVFSRAENLQLILGISTTYGLWEAEWPIAKNVGLAIRWSPSSSPALATCWFCSRSSPIQINGHTCK